MTLSQEEFNSFIQKLEIFAQTKPRLYKLRVALLALLGYGYVILILIGTLALLVGIIWLMFNSKSFNILALKPIIFLGTLALILLRALCVSFSPPQGLALQRKDVPYLFKLVDELSSKLQSPRFHHILISLY